eukprot:gnl/TRDRNA2_/TRDRNA2_128585_c0_seq1.p1 gnl/TRDRNA2_/TRDRNA2_128585_c0~~gnl/TRDRNA2_/TRDRNA2_128585_c0_seq1.p1  ORF type:complete len:304 (+),score=64.45 gnl/TRDRNA2_/TRDRNA2_128585_c0_seq1:309-1220(+)
MLERREAAKKAKESEEARDGKEAKWCMIEHIVSKYDVPVKEIREKSGADIDVRHQSEDRVHVLISGTARAVATANLMLLDAARDVLTDTDGREPMPAASASGVSSSGASGEHGRQRGGGDLMPDEVPEGAASTAETSMGSDSVKATVEKCGALVDVNKNATGCQVKIVGTTGQVASAKTLADETVELPRHAAGRVIGAGGSRIQELELRSGARIDVSQTDISCTCRITGMPEAVASAKAMVLDVAAAHRLKPMASPRSGSAATPSTPPPPFRAPHAVSALRPQLKNPPLPPSLAAAIRSHEAP